ncbi:SpoIIIAH-like family protein [Lawsonibacter celer]|jgi:stage III sporulation protein AH|uniref:SpoIIIAH-like family protein n=1 Tax=Lawsonibacter celer TaxID=2986526 RepID=UPI0016473DE2|nr:SpoIIIAH-like family protein [Lawsonibacter celer]
MKVWKRNAVVAAIVLFVCAAVYLNWSYQKDGDTADVGKTLGQATLVGGQSSDPLVSTTPAASPDATASPAPEAQQKSGYFASARLNREQARDSALSLLQEAASGENADEAMKEELGLAIQTLADFTVSEAQIENLVTAKGYADCVAFIGDDSISVVVAAAEGELGEADIAKITEIVTGETGYPASQIKIIPTQE